MIEAIARTGISALDTLLRRVYQVQEFTQAECCLLRIALGKSDREIVLSDGTKIHRGEPIAEIHFWNERIPPTPENIAAIHEESTLLSCLVEDLRELALAEAGQLAIKKEPTQVEELIQRAMDNLRPQAEEKGIELVTDLPAALPPVQADPHRLEQVLRNLLSNGLRYTPAGGRITVTARGVDGGVQVSVADTGPGIPPEDLPYVFERFWRGDKARSRTHGQTGLGLAIAKQLVEAHGGRIWAESPSTLRLRSGQASPRPRTEPAKVTGGVGKGSTFTVWLPEK